MTLSIPRHIYNQMIDHICANYPEESCGLLAGRNNHISQIHPIENALHSPVAYRFEPAAQIRAMLDIDAQQLDLIAIFHSHPNAAATPSQTDLAEHAYPETAQIIISISPAATNQGFTTQAVAYNFDNDHFYKINLKIL